MAGKTAFWSALAGVVVLLLYAIIGGASYPGYSHVSQYLSELGAVGAPHAELVSWAGFFVFGVLIIIFSISALLALPAAWRSPLGFAGLLLYALGSVQAAFFPCDPGCSGPDPSLSQVLHTALGGISYLSGLIGLLILGLAARRWDGGKHLAVLGIGGGVIGMIAFAGLDPSNPWLGLAQRVLEACINVWILACAFYLRDARSLRLG